jgi:hypothetical protein
VIGDRSERAADTGVVDHARETAEPVDRSGDRARDLRLLPHVDDRGGYGVGVTGLGGQPGGRGRVLLVHVRRDHRESRIQEFQHGCPADAAASPGDHRGALARHVPLPLDPSAYGNTRHSAGPASPGLDNRPVTTPSTHGAALPLDG